MSSLSNLGGHIKGTGGRGLVTRRTKGTGYTLRVSVSAQLKICATRQQGKTTNTRHHHTTQDNAIVRQDKTTQGNRNLIQDKARQDKTRQAKTTQHNTTQHNTTQHNTTQHNTTQHNTTQPPVLRPVPSSGPNPRIVLSQ